MSKPSKIVKPPANPRMVLYIRVSTEKQAAEGHSLEAQEAKLRAYALAKDYEVAAVLVDAGKSGSGLDRPAMKEALAMLDAGTADGIMVAKLDRLTRSLRDVGDLLDRYFTKGKVLCSLNESLDTSSPMGRVIIKIMGALAEMEREQASDRTRDAAHYMKSQGQAWGEAPIGHMVETRDGRNYHVLLPGWERALDIALAGTARGALCPEIGRDLATAGFMPNANADAWDRTQVRRFIETAKRLRAAA